MLIFTLVATLSITPAFSVPEQANSKAKEMAVVSIPANAKEIGPGVFDIGYRVYDGKTSIVGHSLGGYIAAEVTIENKNLVERLVLIDSSGMLKKPTPLLEEYLQVAMNPTADKVRKVFEQMVADPARIPSKLVDGFIARINSPNAKYAFKSTLQNSANTQIGLERLELIEDIPTLILWGTKDKVIPTNHSELFKEAIMNSRIEIIQDAGHAPFAEKPDQVCEILRNFLT